MNFYAISALVNLVTSAGVGIFVLIKNPHGKVHRNFSYFCLAAAIWSFGYIFWQMSESYEQAYFWCRVLFYIRRAFYQPGKKKTVPASHHICLYNIIFFCGNKRIYTANNRNGCSKIIFSFLASWWPAFYPISLFLFLLYIFCFFFTHSILRTLHRD